jgi:ubiquinone/menaquinone biosynthesis C-methylase UbiE
MTDYAYKVRDFEHPSILFFFEDILKNLIGGFLFYNRYFNTFELKGDERILDFGCGGGVGSRFLASRLNKGGYLTCIDTSSYWMTKAKKRLGKYTNVKCILGDIRELNIPDSSFDVISTIHVIHDIDPAYRADIVNILCRKLILGGLMFIREPTKKSHGMPINEIQTLLSNAGLKEIGHKIDKTEYSSKFQKSD